MFYILNFENHKFTSCDNAALAEAKIQDLLSAGCTKDDLEIVNGFSDDVRLNVDQFRNICKEEELIQSPTVTPAPSYTIDPEKLQVYLKDDMIMEFASAEECMAYFNTYDSQHFTSVDEMKSYQGQYGFGYGDKWYHISFDEALDVKFRPQVNSRLSGLQAYQKNEETLKRAAEMQKQNEANTLIAQIQALKPRIDELIATGNACLQNNIPLTGQAFGMRESYETNQFFTNSWSHLVGFAGNPYAKDCYIEFMGINAGGACGQYDFRTDGERVFSVHEKNPFDIRESDIGHMKRFVSKFDEFEISFYSYVDKVIEKQKHSVDKLIANAHDRSKTNTPPTNKDKENKDFGMDR